MLRPYLTATIGDSPCQSVPGVLRDQRVGVDLRLRDRHQHAKIRRLRRLEFEGLSIVAVPDHVLSPLAFAGELEQPFTQDDVAADGTERVRLRHGRARTAFSSVNAVALPGVCSFS